MMSNYDIDYYAWANDQARLLRSGNLSNLDIENIAEELESLGKSEKRELKNRLVVLLTHLLKWQFQSIKRTKSWEVTIINQRIELADLLQENPSLKAQVEDLVKQAYQLAVNEAYKYTDLKKDDFPATCPYTQEQIFNQDFWPSA
jgi:hypothetical protein